MAHRHLCYNKGDGQCFSKGPKGSKVTRASSSRHSYNKGDVQQQRVTFVHVTIGHFLCSGWGLLGFVYGPGGLGLIGLNLV